MADEKPIEHSGELARHLICQVKIDEAAAAGTPPTCCRCYPHEGCALK